MLKKKMEKCGLLRSVVCGLLLCMCVCGFNINNSLSVENNIDDGSSYK